jgi:hemoglobin
MDLNLFERIGGEPTVEAAVNKFYDKFIEQPEITQFFNQIRLPAQIDKMRNFITLSLTGNTQYSREAIRQAHAPLVERGLNDKHFDLFVSIMNETLVELDIPKELIEEFVQISEDYRDDVLNR